MVQASAVSSFSSKHQPPESVFCYLTAEPDNVEPLNLMLTLRENEDAHSQN
jgi:hypothetical protein